MIGTEIAAVLGSVGQRTALCVAFGFGAAFGGSSRAFSADTQVPAIAAPASASEEPRGNIWSFGLTGIQQNLKGGIDNEVVGSSAAVQIGKGFVSRFWYYDISIDILQGPYPSAHSGQLSVDFSGYGASAWVGVSAQNVDLRSARGGYGFALGLSYAAETGRMIGRNRLDDGKNTDFDKSLVSNFVINTSTLSLVPGVFFTWMTPERPRGNTPELLLTRVEGYMLVIGAATPILATFNSTTTLGSGDASKDHGNLNGYTIILNLTALLGT